MNSLDIKIINQLKDNYSFIIYSKKNDAAIIVDPAEADNHIDFLKKNNLELNSVFITHHHKDHTAGLESLLKSFPKTLVYSPDKSIYGTTHLLESNDLIDTPFNKFEILTTPGHTLDHIILYDKENLLLFCGDVLFRLGCGRIFEGTFKQMHESLKKINILPNGVSVYCGHEYTISNLCFLESIFDNLKILKDERKKIETQIKETAKSIPFNLGREKVINPFLNQNSPFFNDFKIKYNLSDFEMFKLVREKKDQF